MSKKRFTEGMENLFEERDHLPEEQAGQAHPPAPEGTEEAGKDEPRKKHSRKDFSDDLATFLQEAFEESFDKQMSQERKDAVPPSTKRRTSKPMGGLDALIRSTVEPSTMRLQNRPVRRLTLTFDEQKLSKLKQIARVERAYLKDVIDKIVADFIKDYEAKKGKL